MAILGVMPVWVPSSSPAPTPPPTGLPFPLLAHADFTDKSVVFQDGSSTEVGTTPVANVGDTIITVLDKGLDVNGDPAPAGDVGTWHNWDSARAVWNTDESSQTVADEAARLALTGLAVGTVVSQTDDSVYDYQLRVSAGEADSANWNRIKKNGLGYAQMWTGDMLKLSDFRMRWPTGIGFAGTASPQTLLFVIRNANSGATQRTFERPGTSARMSTSATQDTFNANRLGQANDWDHPDLVTAPASADIIAGDDSASHKIAAFLLSMEPTGVNTYAIGLGPHASIQTLHLSGCPSHFGNEFQIGEDGTTQAVQISCHEIAFWDRQLDEAEQTQVLEYLAGKYPAFAGRDTTAPAASTLVPDVSGLQFGINADHPYAAVDSAAKPITSGTVTGLGQFGGQSIRHVQGGAGTIDLLTGGQNGSKYFQWAGERQVRFDTTNDSEDEQTIVIAFEPVTNGVAQNMFENAANTRITCPSNAGADVRFGCVGWVSGPTQNFGTMDNFCIGVMGMSATPGNAYQHGWDHNGAVTSETGLDATRLFTGANTDFRIGEDSFTNPFVGKIYEAYLFKGLLSAAELETVRAHMQARYGITLAPIVTLPEPLHRYRGDQVTHPGLGVAPISAVTNTGTTGGNFDLSSVADCVYNEKDGYGYLTAGSSASQLRVEGVTLSEFSVVGVYQASGDGSSSSDHSIFQQSSSTHSVQADVSDGDFICQAGGSVGNAPLVLANGEVGLFIYRPYQSTGENFIYRKVGGAWAATTLDLSVTTPPTAASRSSLALARTAIASTYTAGRTYETMVYDKTVSGDWNAGSPDGEIAAIINYLDTYYTNFV